MRHVNFSNGKSENGADGQRFYDFITPSGLPGFAAIVPKLFAGFRIIVVLGFSIVMACNGQMPSHMPQPTHLPGLTRSACTFKSPLNSGNVISRQSKLQISTHIEQALHCSASMDGLYHWSLGFFSTIAPMAFMIALFGHTLPHTPQSMQRLSLMVWCCFSIPVIAPTGQFFAHCVHPMQASVM
jgi:hypothetical protein